MVYKMEFPAARLNDTTTGGGSILLGSINVFVNNIPLSFAQAPVSPHGCCGSPVPASCFLHCFSVIAVGSESVFVNNKQVARVNDRLSCIEHSIASGSINVSVG